MDHANTEPDGLVYIDLEEPAPWWRSLVGLVVAILIALVLVAPWVIDRADHPADVVAHTALQTTNSVCRPNSSGLPGILDPTLASWGRFCEWFIAPDTDTQYVP